MRRSLVLSTVVVSAVALLMPLACGPDVAGPLGGPLSPLVISGNAQQGVVGTTLPQPLVIRTADARSKLLKNVLVEFRVTSGSGSVVPATTRSDQNGYAQANWTLGTSTSEAQTVEARLVSNGATQGTFIATALPGSPAQITKQAGDTQTAVHNTNVAIAPVVRISDQYGNPIPSLVVTFSVATGGGSIDPPTTTTDAQGAATVGRWTLGSVGQNTLNAAVSGLPAVTFTATATVGPPALFYAVLGNNQVVRAGTPVGTPPRVRAQDSYGIPIAGASVTFTITTGAGSISGPSVVTTDSTGVATVGGWVLGSVPGTNTLRATLGSMPPVDFTATGTPGSATQIAINAGDRQTADPSAAVAIAPSVIVRDSANNPVSGVAVTFQVTVGGGTISGPNPVTTNAAGIAAVGAWTLGAAPGGNALTATVSGLAPVRFTATGGHPVVAASRSSVTVSPISIVASAGEITATITVTARDTNSLPVEGAAVTLTASGEGNAITQPTSVTDANGVTTGAISATVSGYRKIWAVFDGKQSFPANFEVRGGPPVSMAIYGGNNQVAAVGTAVVQHPQVLVLDQFGNGAYGTLVSWEVTSGGGSVGDNPSPGVFPNGVATSGQWTLGPAAGTNTLRASIEGTALEVTFSATGEASYWTTLAPLPTRRFTLAAGAVNGLVYATGGLDYDNLATVEAYDPVSNTWSSKTPMPTRRGEHGVAVVNGILYAIGGITYGPGGSSYGAVWDGWVETYDQATDSWTTRTPMPTPRYDFGTAVVNGIIYTIGGGGCATPTLGACTTVEAYDPVTDTWTTKASLPTARYILAAAEVNGIIYAVGGRNDANFWMGTVEAYDPATDTWTTKASLPTPRFALGAAAAGGRIFAMGGYRQLNGYAENTDLVEAYDPATNSWVAKPHMLSSRVYFGTAVLNGLIYAIGGDGDGGASMSSAEVLHP